MTNKTNAKEFVNRLTRPLVTDVDVAVKQLMAEHYITENQHCDVDWNQRAEKLNILDERIGELLAIKTRLVKMTKT